MIVELGVPASVVSLMVALPIIFAPARALIGHRSDTYRSFLGWRRVPFIWMGTMLQFGGFAVMPFALLVLTGEGQAATPYAGEIGAALAFLLVGAGLHTTQTAGLALACDLASDDSRPSVVALLYVMLLVGMLISALVFSALLSDFSHMRLIQVVQGAAVITMVLNLIALWKQEGRNRAMTDPTRERPAFRDAWAIFTTSARAKRLLIVVALGTAAFSMQDVLLEPYGGQVLHLGVSATTMLTALLAGGTIVGLTFASRGLVHGMDPCRLAAFGALAGLPAFACVIMSAPLDSVFIFRTGTALIGFGGGLFAVGMLTAAMDLARDSRKRHRAWRLGCGPGDSDGACRSHRRRAARFRSGNGRTRPARTCLRRSKRILRRRLSSRDRAAVCDADRDRASGSIRAGRRRHSKIIWSCRISRLTTKETEMEKGAITGYIDVAQVTLYVFWAFFFGLVFWLRKEDRREGYPLESDPTGRVKDQRLPAASESQDLPDRATAHRPSHRTSSATTRPVAARRVGAWPGAPLVPTGNPLVDGVGPAAWAERSTSPIRHGTTRTRSCPARTDAHYGIANGDPDPRGMAVIAADGKVAGTVTDIWVDRAEHVVRYLEVDAGTPGTGPLLVPMNLTKIGGSQPRDATSR